MDETAQTIVVIYFSGHGILEINSDKFKTCAVLNANEVSESSEENASAASNANS